ncbi:DUF1642 domain-containing protein [Enterococcus durans]|uniref:DUF1642 domain-containing protein n=1 Tax=Enterococcus durans TaxID=53345 RepID=UPI002891EADB|nr:DUF1642 domain-containing protein [Enterococcus durans]MDT2771993.1 DUF1642 domain-containing protein [Enterococcus durans]
MNKKVLIDKQALIDELMKIPGVGSNSDALETIKRFPSYEPQKPVVPKFVAEWIEYAKKKGDSLAISFKPWNLYGVEYSKADRWIEDNQETFARAWIDGYEVEKEQLYVMPVPYIPFPAHYCVEDDHISFRQGNAQKFTQAELDRYFPDIKQFAVTVEEVEG